MKEAWSNEVLEVLGLKKQERERKKRSVRENHCVYISSFAISVNYPGTKWGFFHFHSSFTLYISFSSPSFILSLSLFHYLSPSHFHFFSHLEKLWGKIGRSGKSGRERERVCFIYFFFMVAITKNDFINLQSFPLSVKRDPIPQFKTERKSTVKSFVSFFFPLISFALFLSLFLFN